MHSFEYLILTACIAALVLSLSLAPLGCFLIWRRQSFFGESFAHSALFGVSLGYCLNISPVIGIILLCILLACSLSFGHRLFSLPPDTWLSLLTFTLVGLGYILLKILSKNGYSNTASIEHFMFGDLLLCTKENIITLYGASFLIISVLVGFWKKFIHVTIDPDEAQLKGISPTKFNFILLLMLSFMIAAAIPITGALLTPGLLIIPGCCASQVARSPKAMVLFACLSSLLITFLGIYFSFYFDLPVGPVSMVSGFILFLVVRSFSNFTKNC